MHFRDALDDFFEMNGEFNECRIDFPIIVEGLIDLLNLGIILKKMVECSL